VQALLLELVDLDKKTTCMQTIISYVGLFFCNISLFELFLFLLLLLGQPGLHHDVAEELVICGNEKVKNFAHLVVSVCHLEKLD
jgi:hypothetical protein